MARRRPTPSRAVRRELERPPVLPEKSGRAEGVARVVIEIHPETLISTTWRLYAVEGPNVAGRLSREQRMLRSGGRVYGGTLREAHQAAIFVATRNGFLYRPPKSYTGLLQAHPVPLEILAP